jgi:hypothetical protein
MDELKEKAASKYSELLKETKEQNEKLEISIVLLDRLCTLKESQQNSDNSFRDSWRKAKVKDTSVSLWVLILANIALYLDVIKVDGNGAFITALMDFFS